MVDRALYKAHEILTRVGPIQSVPTCLIYSFHPAVIASIMHAVCSDSKLQCQVSVHAANSQPLNGASPSVLILDTCSVDNWAECIQKWCIQKGSVIAMVSSEAYSRELELKLLYLGASGVLSFGDNLMEKLPKAIYAVAEQQLWIRREVVSFYLKNATQMLRKLSKSNQDLTKRENEICDLMKQNLCNRAISQRLTISERTTKFHVSNVLRKLKLSNRRQLWSLSTSSLTYPEWLLPKDEAGLRKMRVFWETTALKTA